MGIKIYIYIYIYIYCIYSIWMSMWTATDLLTLPNPTKNCSFSRQNMRQLWEYITLFCSLFPSLCSLPTCRQRKSSLVSLSLLVSIHCLSTATLGSVCCSFDAPLLHRTIKFMLEGWLLPSQTNESFYLFVKEWLFCNHSYLACLSFFSYSSKRFIVSVNF